MPTSESTLRRHVIESNKIEYITADKGNPLYDSHFAAAQVAAKGGIVHPNELHKILAQGVYDLSDHAGQYRNIDIWVGEREMPQWECVPELMDDLWRLVQEYSTLPASPDILDEAADLIHVRLLCIHPYADGNGRTARLVHNMLRVHRGLPWHIEYAEEKELYCVGIHLVEDAFKEEYPHVYKNSAA